jgi:hypothetical protein
MLARVTTAVAASIVTITAALTIPTIAVLRRIFLETLILFPDIG